MKLIIGELEGRTKDLMRDNQKINEILNNKLEELKQTDEIINILDQCQQEKETLIQ